MDSTAVSSYGVKLTGWNNTRVSLQQNNDSLPLSPQPSFLSKPCLQITNWWNFREKSNTCISRAERGKSLKCSRKNLMNVDLGEQSRNSARDVTCSCCQNVSRKGLQSAEVHLLFKMQNLCKY